MTKRRLPAALLAGAAALAVAACGSNSSTTSSGSSTSAGSGGGGDAAKPSLTVSAAASLQKAFTQYATQFTQATPRYSFAGSDVLAAQIEQGIKPDVYAAANTKLPKALYAKGLVEKPVVFAGNELVLAVPANSKITSLAGIEKSGVTVAIGTATVPVGDYTKTVLARLPAADAAKIKANVKDEEPAVTGIVGKLTEGAVDAGFLYITDVKAADGKLKAIALPSSIKPKVAYGVAVVKGAAHPKQAQAFINGLLSGPGQQDLLAAGFLPPPTS
jgi:molybdate transport system substrate-binding protein